MNEIVAGIADVLAPWPLLYVLIGVVSGITVGAIPGLTGSMLITLAVPMTFYMPSTQAMVLLVSMYVGSISGGLITATLLRIPGTPAAMPTTFDGYPMAQRGEPGRAIGYGIFASFIGGLISWIFLATLSPPLARVALKLGSFEYFSMVISALVLIASLGQGSFLKGLIAGFLGMLTAMPGMDPISAVPRLHFGTVQLIGGFHVLPVLIGLFGIGKIFSDIMDTKQKSEAIPMSYKGIFLGPKQLKQQALNLIRSSCIGTWVGMLPGIGAGIGSILSYTVAKSTSERPEQFGTGCAEGIVASEAGNNATVAGALIPLITLGIPGSLNDAILMGALLIHNVQVGPLLFTNHPDVAYTIIGTAFVANLVMFVLMLAATPYFAKLADTPRSCLLPVILTFCVLGTFSINNRMFDVWVMLIFGAIGFCLEKCRVPLGPFIIGMVLAPMAESPLREGLMASDGSLLPLVTRPVSCTFLVIGAVSFAWSIYKELIQPSMLRAKARAEISSSPTNRKSGTSIKK